MSHIDYSWDLRKEEFNFELDYFNEQDQEDKLWQARTGLNPDTLCGAIETIIFMSDRPVTLPKIKQMIDTELPLRVIHESLARLQGEYEEKHHGLRLQEVADGYQFRTKATYSRFVQKLFKMTTLVLSPTALETLAMVAYKQPVSKNDIENIRGVDSSHILRGLMDKRLVKIVGRSNEMGRPALYGTSTEFLEIFNINTIDDLPSESELTELATTNTAGQISDIRNVVLGDKTKFLFDEFSELEELSEQIKEIDSDTVFTKSLKVESKKRISEEGEVRKSAFDILEEFVNNEETATQNKIATDSDIIQTILDARIVDLLHEEGLINAPELDEDVEEISEIPPIPMEASEEVEEASNDLGIELEGEAKAFAAALDEAFDNLQLNAETPEGELDIEAANAIDEISSQAIESAKELDLDLNFLKEELDNSNPEL